MEIVNRVAGSPGAGALGGAVVKIYHVGISGGKDSTALLLWVVNESGIPLAQVRASFCDTGNEAPETYEFVKFLSEKVFPIQTIKPERDFYELAKWKKRFPSTRARFCTTELKTKPTREHAWKLKEEFGEIELLSGVRGSESLARSVLPERSLDGFFGLPVWRPLIRWTLADVWAIHERYRIKRNPLYDMGMKRVGCFPCIMSSKGEIMKMVERFPDRIAFLRERETEQGSTFFPPTKTPERFRTGSCKTKDGRTVKLSLIDDVVAWAREGIKDAAAMEAFNARQGNLELETDDTVVCDSSWGACE
jgi:3'-phosphoadenosine 5'-phosphosulfate sulfotransferase (PAPS reductase)/FAD synthetase